MDHPFFYIGVPALIIAISAGIGLSFGLLGSIGVCVVGIAICWLTDGRAAVFGLPIFIGGLLAVFGGDLFGRF